MPPPATEAFVANRLGPVGERGKALNTYALNGHGGPLRSVLATGREMIIMPIKVGAAELTQREMKIHSLPELSIGTMKRSAGIDNDGLPADAIHVDTLLSATKASDVLRLFGEPEPVGESKKVHQVKVGDSTITAYDGSQTLVLTHVVDKETQHSIMLNGGILRDIPAEDREKGQPLGREIILAPQDVKITDADGIVERRRSVTVVEIEDGEVFVTTTRAGKFQETDQTRSELADGLETRSFTLVEGDEVMWKGSEVRNATDVADDLTRYDRAEVRKKIDAGVTKGNTTIQEKWGGEVEKIRNEKAARLKQPKGEQNIEAEGLIPGERIAVKEALQNIDPYLGLFELMGAESELVDGKTGNELFMFHAGTLAVNSSDNLDEVISLDSRFVGSGRVGFYVRDTKTGEKEASLFVHGRTDGSGVEEIDLSKAYIEVVKEPRADIELGVRFIIPGEEDKLDRVVTVRTAVEKWESKGGSGTSFFGHATDIYTANSEKQAA